jgi:hypothetical protein
MIIIKSQNPVFSEPKKSLITEAFVFSGEILQQQKIQEEILQSPQFAISKRKQTPKSFARKHAMMQK